MGVGDYVHSKEAGHHRPPKLDVSNQSRQQIAEQARVEVPTPRLIAPAPLPISRPTQFEHSGGPPAPGGSHAPNDNGAKKDMFDTDVEGVDDSTIAATSVVGVEDLPYRYSPAPNARQQGAAANSLHQFQQTRRPFDSQWYDNFGDRAMKTAGFDSDEVDNESQLTSVAGDDEASDGTNESVVPIRKRLNDEPLSKRLHNFWNAGRKTYQQPENQAQVESSKIPTFTRSIQDAKRTSQVLPATAPRKVTLPPNTSATPRTRFSPPKPTLLEQLDLTPTRRTPGPRPQKSQRITSIETSDSVENVGLGFFSNSYGRRGSVQSITAFDMTNIDALNDDDDPINDPFSRRLSVQRISPDQHNPKKRHIEPDYPPDILYQKSFAELQAEPFDHIPAAAPSPNATQETQPDPEDKIPYLMNLSDADRRTYFSNLSMNEWEDCGDQLIDQFTQVLTKMKDLRHARRKTAAVFEAEIRRRHESVEEQSSDLSKKLDGMRTGGAEVLRGRTP
ncbi:extracellular mutant protein 11-domain-containing protein [Aspergillus pseudonomiae]|uniref:Extracellular mutant protein 11-domain-containing protein n=1 Tax=Aspergillus pseudonomiae TaxID=1506151 RepID=A0A5N7DB94_9EURO|nr:extracellular mutant protein 11-domain-containing protein [Aspergillus pseudonomiae]KAE8403651.1 extracellular mutant protein 11-domain-containing protein [Aspergillus pseudonomiae]